MEWLNVIALKLKLKRLIQREFVPQWPWWISERAMSWGWWKTCRIKDGVRGSSDPSVDHIMHNCAVRGEAKKSD
jgi:hypothetical protein